MNYCDIDLANKSSAVCITDQAGKVVFERVIPTDEDGLRQRLKAWPPMRCVLEASPLAESTAYRVEQLGHEAVMIDPRRAKALIKTKKKTDKLDARTLAKMARTGWYTEVYRKSAKARLLRSQLQARRGLVESANRQYSRVRVCCVPMASNRVACASRTLHRVRFR